MHNEKTTQNNMPDGEYIGVISDIKVDKHKNSYCIKVRVHIWDDAEVQTYVKSFRTIFGLGREKFQKFCDNFELYDEDYRLDLSQALGKMCIAVFDSYRGFNKIKPARKNDLSNIDIKATFKNIAISSDVGDIPTIVENYHFFEYDEDGYESDTEYYGIVRSWNCYPNKDNLKDYDVCVKIAVLNGCKVNNFCYFINNINYIGEHDLQLFEDVFDIKSEYEVNLDKAIGKLCKVTLYTAKSGRTYIRSVDYFMCDNEYEEKQYRLWAQDYARLMNMSDEEFAMCDF